MFSVRLFIADYYMNSPLPGLDNGYSEFRGVQVKQVPVIRVFGSSSTGQKTCLHIHGVFPYIYVPFDGCVDHNKYMYQLASSLDKAINISLGQANSTTQHVYKIILVSGIPYYGYHKKEHQFFKIYFYNPLMIKKAAELLQNGAILNQMFQPHEAHLPFVLQFMIDFNLYGMNLVSLRDVKFRRDADNPGVLENIPEELLLPERVCKISTCELEIDALAADILNKNEITGQLSVNPGLKAIWEDEKQRRRGEFRASQPTPQSSQPRPFVQHTDSEAFYKDQLQKRLESMSLAQSGSTPSTLGKSVPYPAETPEGVSILDASILQIHVPSIAESRIRTSQQSVHTDDSVVNEEIVLSLMAPSQPAAVSSSDDTSFLSSQDLKLAEVLQELVDDDSILSSQKPSTEQNAEEEINEDLELHDLTQTMEELEEHSPGRPVGDAVDEAFEDSDDVWDDSFWSGLSGNIPQLDGTNDSLESTPRRKTKKRNITPKSLVRQVLEKTTITKTRVEMKGGEEVNFAENETPCDVQFLGVVRQASPTPSEVSSDGSVEFLCELENSVNDNLSVCESEISDVVGDTFSLQTELFTDNFNSFPLMDSSDPAFTSVPATALEFDNSKTSVSEIDFNIDTVNNEKFFKGVLIGDPSFTAQLSFSEKDELLENQACIVPEVWSNDSASDSRWLSRERNLVDSDELDESCDLLRPYEDENLEDIVVDKNCSGEVVHKEKRESSPNRSVQRRKYSRSSGVAKSSLSTDPGARTKLRSWQNKFKSLGTDEVKQLFQGDSNREVILKMSEVSSGSSGVILKNVTDQNDNFVENSKIGKRTPNGFVSSALQLQRKGCEKLDMDKQEVVFNESPSISKDQLDKTRRRSPICPNDLFGGGPCSSKDVRSALRRRCQQKVKVPDIGSASPLLNINSIDITEKPPTNDTSVPQCTNRKCVRTSRKCTRKSSTISDAAVPLSSNCNLVILSNDPCFGARSGPDLLAKQTEEMKISQSDPEMQRSTPCHLSDINKNVKELLKQKIKSKKEKQIPVNKSTSSDERSVSLLRCLEEETSNCTCTLHAIDNKEDVSVTCINCKLIVSNCSNNCHDLVNERLPQLETYPVLVKEASIEEDLSKQNSSNEHSKDWAPGSLEVHGESIFMQPDPNRDCCTVTELSNSGGTNCKTERGRSPSKEIIVYDSMGKKAVSPEVLKVTNAEDYDSLSDSDSCKSPSSYISGEILKSFRIKPCYVKLERVTLIPPCVELGKYPEKGGDVLQSTSDKALSIADQSVEDDCSNYKTEEQDLALSTRVSPVYVQETCMAPHQLSDVHSSDLLKNQVDLQSMDTLRCNASYLNVTSPKIAVSSPRKTRSLSGLKSVLQAESPRVADTIDTLPENARTDIKYASACIPLHHDELERIDASMNNSSNSYETIQDPSKTSNVTLGEVVEFVEDKEHTNIQKSDKESRFIRDSASLQEQNIEISSSVVKCRETEILVHNGNAAECTTSTSNLTLDSKSYLDACVLQSESHSSIPVPNIRSMGMSSPLHHKGDNLAASIESCIPAENLLLHSPVDKNRNHKHRATDLISDASPVKPITKGKLKLLRNKPVIRESEDPDDNIPLVKIKHALVNENLKKQHRKSVVSQYSDNLLLEVNCNNLLPPTDLSSKIKNPSKLKKYLSSPAKCVSPLKLKVQSSGHTKNVPAGRHSSKHSHPVAQGITFLKNKKPKIQNKSEASKSNAISPSGQKFKMSAKENISQERDIPCKVNEHKKAKVTRKRKSALPLKPAKVVLFRLNNDPQPVPSACSSSSKRCKNASKFKKTMLNSVKRFKKVVSLDGTVDSSTSEDSEDSVHSSKTLSERTASSSSGELLCLPSQILTPSPKKRKQTTRSPSRTPKKNSYKPLEIKITKSPKQRKIVLDNVKKSNAIRKKSVGKQTIIFNQRKLTSEDLKVFQPIVRIERLDLKHYKLKVDPVSKSCNKKRQQGSAKASGHLKSSRSVSQSVPTG